MAVCCVRELLALDPCEAKQKALCRVLFWLGTLKALGNLDQSTRFPRYLEPSLPRCPAVSKLLCAVSSSWQCTSESSWGFHQKHSA